MFSLNYGAIGCLPDSQSLYFRRTSALGAAKDEFVLTDEETEELSQYGGIEYGEAVYNLYSISIEEVQPEFTWKGNAHTLNLYFSDRAHPDYQSMYIAYELIKDDPDEQLIFSGFDYSPSAVLETFSLGSAMALLSFLTILPEDTDGEYFLDYTPEQIAWRDEYAEELRALASNIEEELQNA